MADTKAHKEPYWAWLVADGSTEPYASEELGYLEDAQAESRAKVWADLHLANGGVTKKTTLYLKLGTFNRQIRRWNEFDA